MSNKRNHVIQKHDKGQLIAHRDMNKRMGTMKFKAEGTFPMSIHCDQPMAPSKIEHVGQKKDILIQERLRARKKRRNVEEKERNTTNPAFELGSSIFKNANEDILFEIFVRLPEYRSVVLCGAVCPQWHAVISQPKFVPSFIRKRQNCHSRPFMIMFFFADIIKFESMKRYQPFACIHFQNSMFLCGRKPFVDWDFMPSRMIIRASLDDLLLVSTGRQLDYYICNSISRQWVQLPKSQGTEPCGFALVRKLDQYKVVFIHYPRYHIEDAANQIATSAARIFCFSTGQWTLSTFSYPLPKELRFNDLFDVVTRDGVLYWLETPTITFDRIMFFDVFDDQWGIIDFPDDLIVRKRRRGDSYGKVYLGLVCGEIRLVQIVKRYKSCFVIKVWELQHYLNNKEHANMACWVLINETKITRPNTKKLRGFAVHPNNGNMLMIWGRRAFEHSITTDTCVERFDLTFSIKDHRIVSIPLMHPPVPTPVPSFPECAADSIMSFFT